MRTYEYPAVMIGGPPNSGKSVLINSLTKALRRANCPHYLLRAAPDGEGDWYYEISAESGRILRKKGQFTPAYVEQLDQYLAHRHYPLLVDVGGLPTPKQQRVFRHCTHAILLVGDRPDDPDRYAIDHAHWHTILSEQDVALLADMRSVLGGETRLTGTDPIRGTQTGLERGTSAEGPLFDALIQQLETLFAGDKKRSEPEPRSLAPAHIEYVLVMEDLARELGAANGRFAPEMLQPLRDYLPQAKPLGLFGRAPNWVYASLAELAAPAEMWQFDPRLGWIQPPELSFYDSAALDPDTMQPGWLPELRMNRHGPELFVDNQSQFLDIDFPEALPLPLPPEGEGVVLNGRLPHWIVTAVTRALAPSRPWLAIYQPQLNGAVVVASQNPAIAIGQLLPLDAG